MGKPWWRSSAIVGALGAGVSALLSPEVLGVMPKRYAVAGVVIGAVWSKIGERKAIAKNGRGQ